VSYQLEQFYLNLKRHESHKSSLFIHCGVLFDIIPSSVPLVEDGFLETAEDAPAASASMIEGVDDWIIS